MAPDFRACRPRLPGLPSRTALLCGNHAGCVAATQGCCCGTTAQLGLSNSHKASRPLAVLQQHNWRCSTAPRPRALLQQHNCGCATGQESGEKHRIWPEPGRNSTVRAETLCGKSCEPQDASRMPGLPKGPKIHQNPQKTGIWGILGPRALSGPIAAGWRCALITLVSDTAQ